MVCRDAGEDKALKLVTTNSWATSKNKVVTLHTRIREILT